MNIITFGWRGVVVLGRAVVVSGAEEVTIPQSFVK